MWNVHIFRVIGQKCRGLLVIARSTIDLTCLSHAKVKLQGNDGDLIQEKLRVILLGEKNSGFFKRWKLKLP